MSQEDRLPAHLWTCPLCGGKFQKGWKRHGHVKSCNAQLHNALLEQTDPLTEVSATAQGQEKASREDMECEEDDFHSDATTDEEDGEASPRRRSSAVGANKQQAFRHVEEQFAYEDKGRPYNQYNARFSKITPKDMEILLFLQCNDLGVGSSREQKQGVLDYVKSFDTARTRQLPKTIPTCYNRMKKVTIVHICTPFGPILYQASPSLLVFGMNTVHIYNVDNNLVNHLH